MTGVRREEDWEGRNHRHHQPFPLRRGKVVCSSIRCALRPLTIPARARTHRRVNSVILGSPSSYDSILREKRVTHRFGDSATAADEPPIDQADCLMKFHRGRETSSRVTKRAKRSRLIPPRRWTVAKFYRYVIQRRTHARAIEISSLNSRRRRYLDFYSSSRSIFAAFPLKAGSDVGARVIFARQRTRSYASTNASVPPRVRGTTERLRASWRVHLHQRDTY